MDNDLENASAAVHDAYIRGYQRGFRDASSAQFSEQKSEIKDLRGEITRRCWDLDSRLKELERKRVRRRKKPAVRRRR